MFKRFKSLLWMLIFPFAIFTALVYINDNPLHKDDSSKKRTSQFDVKKTKKIQKIEKPKPKPKPRRTQNRSTQLKPANIANSIDSMGLDFAMPGFSMSGGFEEFENEDELIGDTNTSTMDSESVDVAPRVVKRSPIVFPNLARKQGISGYVLVNLLIGKDGSVEDAKIVESKPKEIFDLKVLSSVRAWKFSPASYMGKTVKVWAMQRISFKLE